MNTNAVDGLRLKLPPHRIRRLTVILRHLYGDRYADALDFLRELQVRGLTYREIAEEVQRLGVQVSQFTIRSWMQKSQRLHAGTGSYSQDSTESRIVKGQ